MRPRHHGSRRFNALNRGVLRGFLSDMTGREVLCTYAEKADDGVSFLIKRGYDRLVRDRDVLVVEDNALAIGTLDRFIKVHPASPALDYALYLKGVVNFNDETGFMSFLSNQDMADRDQKAAKESFEAFRELVTRFPDSKYSEDARLRMRYSVNILAKSEINVARFYLNKGAYVAAINRAQAALNDYRDVPALEDALRILIECYDKLGLTQLRDDTRRVLQNTFPNATAAVAPDKAAWWRFWR